MNPFHVGLLSLGDRCRVRVEGIDNANWLVARLSHSFAVKSFNPLRRDVDTGSCTFEVQYRSTLTHAGLEKLLGAIPSVKLVADPE